LGKCGIITEIMNASKTKMKRYTVINNKTGYKNDYSWIAWNIAWGLVFAFGMLTGSMLF
tara:strand:+ start:97 stop:273 length:177 start_codon:yes stop_codon:yes gene_type:complete